MMKGQFVKVLFAVWFGYPFSNGHVKGASAFDGCFEKGQALLWIGGYAVLLELLFNSIIMFELGDLILGWIPGTLHSADKFLYVEVIDSVVI